MRFKHPAWVPVAWVISLGNVGAVWFAAAAGEPWHATIHAILGTALAAGAIHLVSRRRAIVSGDLQEALDQNERLQQTLDAVQPRMQELEERLDFAERLLATERQSEGHDPANDSAAGGRP